jgi:hypothetical protein
MNQPTMYVINIDDRQGVHIWDNSDGWLDLLKRWATYDVRFVVTIE